MIHFYLFPNIQLLLVSNHKRQRISQKYGFKFEILTSSVSRENISLLIERISRSYPKYDIREWYYEKRKLSEETKAKISKSMTGKKRSERAKFITSQKLKGKSNFEGKHHNIDTKMKMAEKKYGNDWNKQKIWAYNSKLDKEIRINHLRDLPKDFSLGRNYDSTESMISASTNLPKEK